MPFQEAQYNFTLKTVRCAASELFANAAQIHLAFPFETLDSWHQLVDEVYAGLQQSIPDLERRDTIVIEGDSDTATWVGCCGYYTGTFMQPWLDIPPTGHIVSMRFHEFYRFEHGKVVEVQALWDIPELMMQANAWPMSRSLGREWHVPSPATQDGLYRDLSACARTQQSYDLVMAMCESLGNYAEGGVEAMQLEKYWHPLFNWYGPSGIGTGRGIRGFRNWHQIPFLNALPDRWATLETGHMFADADYVGFTAWPGMGAHVTGDGWLGIAPSGKEITMRSLDFWRCEKGMIRENWVLVDLLSIYDQLGVDVLARMKEFNKARTHLY